MTNKNLENKFKRFKNKYFKGKTTITGLELEECRQQFLKLIKTK